jgi:hypothetical protein
MRAGEVGRKAPRRSQSTALLASAAPLAKTSPRGIFLQL